MYHRRPGPLRSSRDRGRHRCRLPAGYLRVRMTWSIPPLKASQRPSCSLKGDKDVAVVPLRVRFQHLAELPVPAALRRRIRVLSVVGLGIENGDADQLTRVFAGFEQKTRDRAVRLWSALTFPA